MLTKKTDQAYDRSLMCRDDSGALVQGAFWAIHAAGLGPRLVTVFRCAVADLHRFFHRVDRLALIEEAIADLKATICEIAARLVARVHRVKLLAWGRRQNGLQPVDLYPHGDDGRQRGFGVKGCGKLVHRCRAFLVRCYLVSKASSFNHMTLYGVKTYNSEQGD
jgi:hypothetical protein